MIYALLPHPFDCCQPNISDKFQVSVLFVEINQFLASPDLSSKHRKVLTKKKPANVVFTSSYVITVTTNVDPKKNVSI